MTTVGLALAEFDSEAVGAAVSTLRSCAGVGMSDSRRPGIGGMLTAPLIAP